MDPGASTRRHKHQWILGLIALSAAGLAAIVLYALPHCIPADKLKRVTLGASRGEVVSLLGQAASTTQYSDGRVKISYRKPFRYCTVDLFLDETEHVTGIFHDH